MPAFIHDDFLLSNPAARELYHTFAKSEPIYDYHCHLPPAQIANNHRFADLAEVWLGGDHYKWRALRTNGVAERFVTGSTLRDAVRCAHQALSPSDAPINSSELEVAVLARDNSRRCFQRLSESTITQYLV